MKNINTLINDISELSKVWNNLSEDMKFLLAKTIVGEEPDEQQNKQSSNDEDLDLPEAPNLEMYKETFGKLENVTKEYYKNKERM